MPLLVYYYLPFSTSLGTFDVQPMTTLRLSSAVEMATGIVILSAMLQSYTLVAILSRVSTNPD